jgi:hypothetical protein
MMLPYEAVLPYRNPQQCDVNVKIRFLDFGLRAASALDDFPVSVLLV